MAWATAYRWEGKKSMKKSEKSINIMLDVMNLALD